MSDYTGPGIYAIVPSYADDMCLDVKDVSKKEGAKLQIYKRNKKSQNQQFIICDAGGMDAKAEKGDREYLIIAVHSGLYLTCNGETKVVTTELRSPLDSAVRWKLAHTGNGGFYINNCSKNNPQLNVNGTGKTNGTDVICYKPLTDANVKFFIKSID